MIEISETNLKGVLLIKPSVFEDYRGQYVETYNKQMYTDYGIDVDFVQDDISISDRHVLRGIHGDDKTYKLVSCPHGKFYFVVVNCDKSLSEFGKWQSWTLSDRNRLQVLVPPKYGNAHLVLSEFAIFHYKQSTYYNFATQFTYKWNDPDLGIIWPIDNPILSSRDK